MSVFDAMGVYWAEIADGNPTQRQTIFIENTVKPTGFVLDLSCGTGRHVVPLSRDGYEVVGLDVSSSLLRIAKNRLGSIQLVRADMRHLPFKPEAFTASVSMDTSLGYLPTPQDDVQSLKGLRETLLQEGLLIVDVFNREQLTRKYWSNRRFKMVVLPLLLKLGFLGEWLLTRFFKWREYPSFYLLQRRTVDACGGKLQDLWVVRDKADGKIKVFKHVVRLYEPEVLRGLLEQAGFAVKWVFGDYEGQRFGLSSNRLIFVADAK